MAKKFNFTQAAIDRLPLPATGRDYYADAKTPGLFLAVWDTGVKAFELYKRMGGRPTRLKIGRFPEVTVDQARKEAARMAGRIAQGDNPAEDRRKARGETTIGELFDLYLEGHAKPHKRSWPQDKAQYDRYLAAWKTRKLSNIKPADVTTLHAKIGRDNGHYAANRLLALLSGMFAFAVGLGYAGGNPAKGVTHFKEQSRDRFLRADELQAFFAALADERTSPKWRDFFTIALLTGARRANVMAMKWADLELTRGLWKIPDTESKNKEPLICILPPAAVEILQRRHDDNAQSADDIAAPIDNTIMPTDKQSEYVFPGKGETGHVFDPTKPWKDILKRAKIKDLHIHDLRRTLGSWQAAAGTSLQIIGKSLGHKNINTTAIYARLDLDPVRASVHNAAEAILAAANGHDPNQKALPAPTDTTAAGDKANSPNA